VPIGLVAADIARHGQNVPFQDEWVDPVDIALRTAEGRLTVGDLFRQYNDSRTVFTYALTAVSTAVAGWSLKLEMFASMALAGVVLLLVTSLYGASHPSGRRLVWLPFSVLIFSLAQRRSWLWAIQNQYFFLIAFVVAALWVVRRSSVSWPALLGAAVLTVCATFSFSNGFVLWFVMIPVLWMLGYRRWPYLLGWGAAIALGLAAFFTGYRFHGLERPTSFDPFFLGQFVLVYLGHVFTVREVPVHPPREIYLNVALGGGGLLVFVIDLALLWRSRRRWTDLAPWIGLAAFVLASATLAGIGRGHAGGIEVAMASRYVTLATMFWVAFVAVAVLAMARLGRSRWILAGHGLVLAVLLALFVVGSYEFGKTRATVTEAQRACFLAYPTTRDATCFGNLLSWRGSDAAYAQALSEKMEKLAQYRLAAFGEPVRR
jgi:hypothetical protein